MDTWIYQGLESLSPIVLFTVIAVALFGLGKGADILVVEAVSLSVRLNIPKMLVGATIISLGTTLPEATVSIAAAIKGNPDMALGNAVGSIITNIALIIGVSSVLGKLPFQQEKVYRQGNIQLGTVFMLFVFAQPIFSKNAIGAVPQWAGFLFVGLLGVYLVMSVVTAKQGQADALEQVPVDHHGLGVQIIKLLLGMGIVIMASRILIPAVEITALAIGIPQSVIAATLVAFGTSLPELVTAITAVRKGHGELAVGNIIGANILNVLFVVGASAMVTSGGLLVPSSFYWIQLPIMLLVSLMFRWLLRSGRTIINKGAGFILIMIFIGYTLLSYFWIR